MPKSRTNFWTEEIESNVKNIGDLSIGYKWMHNESSMYFSKIHRRLTYIAMIMGPTASVLIIFDTTYVRTSFPNSIVLSLIALIISFLTSVLVAIIDFADYEELSRVHQLYASKYTGLISNVRRQLGMDTTYRENANDYMSWVNKNYDDLFEVSPHIKPFIKNRYRLFAMKARLPIPEEDLTSVIVKKPSDSESVDSKKAREALEAYNNSTPIKEERKILLDRVTNNMQKYIDTLPREVTEEDIKVRSPKSPDPMRGRTVKSMEVPLDIHQLVLSQDQFDNSTMQYEINRWNSHL